MNSDMKKPVAPQQTGHSKKSRNSKAQKDNSRKIRKGTKLHAVVSHLAKGHKLHRFQAERICHDHVLPSTISGFEQKYGIQVSRELITVPGYSDSIVSVANYWLSPSEQQKAMKLLEVV